MAGVSARPQTFFRISPAEPGEAQCFAVRRGQIEEQSLSVPLYAPEFSEFIKALGNNPLGVTPLGARVEINPRVDVSALPPDTSVGFIPMDAVSDQATGEYTIATVPLEEVNKGYTRFLDGDVLWAKITPSMQNGKSCVVDELPNGVGFGSTEFHVLRPLSPKISSKFVMEFVSQDSLRQFATYAFTGTAGQQRVPATFLESLPFPNISLNRQNELVEAMEAARAERKANLAEADALLAGTDDFLLEILGINLPSVDPRQVFAVGSQSVGKRVDPYFHLPKFARIQDALSEIHSESLGSIAAFSKEIWRPENHENPTFRYIEISTVNPKTGEAQFNEVPTDKAPSRARMKVQADDIIVSLTRPHHGSIAYLGAEFEGCVASTGFAVIRDVATYVRRDYLWTVLRAQFSLDQMIQRASGGNYPAITETELGNITVPVPSMETQEVIATEVQYRHQQARSFREEAESDWQAAKQWFEEQLLGRSVG